MKGCGNRRETCNDWCKDDCRCFPKQKATFFPPDGVVPNYNASALVTQVNSANIAFVHGYPGNLQECCADCPPEIQFVPANIVPSRHFAVLTCMDARILPDRAMGFCAGQAHVIRNAGGRVNEDAVRSLVISYKLLQTTEWFVIHHSDCGMLKFTQEVMDCLLAESLVGAQLLPNANCNTEWTEPESNCNCKWVNPIKCNGEVNKCIDWETINCGLRNSVIEDVTKLRNHPLVPSFIPIYGYVYDVTDGTLNPILEANRIGAACPMKC